MENSLASMRSDRNDDGMSRQLGQQVTDEKVGLQKAKTETVEVDNRHRFRIGVTLLGCPAAGYPDKVFDGALLVLWSAGRIVTPTHQRHAPMRVQHALQPPVHSVR